MIFGYTVEKILEEYWTVSSAIFGKALEFIPDRQQQDIEGKLADSLSKKTDGFPKASIASLTSLNESRLTELDSIWLEAIEEATSTLPELILLEQNEAHFLAREGDTTYITMGKFFKRLRRSSRKGIHSTSNAFRRMFKKPENEFEVAKREVPLKNMIQSLFFDFNDEISAFKFAQYRFCARAFEEIEYWTLTGKESEESTEELTFETLVANLSSAYKDEYSLHQTALNEKFESIKKKFVHDLELVGTIELPSKVFNASYIEKVKSTFNASLEKSSQQWSELNSALSNRIHLVLHLVNFRESVKLITSNFLSKIDHFFYDGILKHHESLKSTIEYSISELESLSNSSKKELSDIGKGIYEKAKKLIRSSIAEPLNIKRNDKYLSAQLDHFIGEMTGLASNQPELSTIIENLKLDKQKPEYEIKEIEWRKFVQRMLGKFTASELDSRKLALDDNLETISDNYLEVLQIIETNLLLIEEVTRKEDENPIDVALKGLERSLNKIDEIENLVLTSRDDITDKVNHQNEELLEKLTLFLEKQDVSEMKWMETQLKVKKSAGDWNTKITARWARLLDKFDLLQRFIFKKYKAYDVVVRTYLGITKPISHATESTNLATFLYETDKKYLELPFIYRRLFDFHREVEANFYIQNPIFFENCSKALSLWKGGFPASVSLIGEKGSGKSTLIRFVDEEMFSNEKKYLIPFLKTYWLKKEMLNTLSKGLQLPECETAEELVSSIKKKRKGSVVIIENLQNCYVRNMSGYDAIKALLYVISETKKEIFWVVTCSRYAWNFFNVVFKVGDYFSHNVGTDNLSNEELEQLILKRQKASGYQLEFIPDASSLKSRAYKKFLDDEKSAQEYLQSKYFNKLTTLAEGNATVAMIFWIRSIKEFNDSQIRIESLEILNVASLDGLDTISLFALSAFILHDSLTPSELSMIINSNESDCEMMISRLVSRGLLVGTNNYYKLNDLVYRQVVRLLKNRNILH